MKIQIKNYYLSAISGVGKFQEAKNSLLNSYTAFAPVRGVDTLSQYVGNELLFPVVAKGYQCIGSVVSKGLSLVSENLGTRVQEGWSDPFASSFLISTSKLCQRVLEPIAAFRPIDYPILRPISQTIIGMARFSDITLKDVTTILEIPARATKIFTSRPWEAFTTDYKSFQAKALAVTVFMIYGFFWVAIKAADLCVRFFQAIAHKVRFGRHITDATRSQIEGIQQRVRNYFIEKIRARETRVRKKVVGNAFEAGTKKVLRLLSSSTIRWMLGSGLLLLASNYLVNYMPESSRVTPIAERNVHWLMEVMTLRSVTLLNIFAKTCAYAAFFKEFINEFSPEYSADKHTLFYRKNLVDGLIKYKKIKQEIQKQKLQNNF